MCLLVLAAALGGCAAVAGLGDLQKDDCAAGCSEAGVDDVNATLPDATTPEASAADGASAIPQITPSEAGAPRTDDGSADAGAAALDAAAPDAFVPSGAACDVACGTANATSSACNGNTCAYTCTSGHADCNAATKPNGDGCECASPGCCNGACQVKHTDGIGQSFFDCAPLGTYTQALAFDACAAFTGDATKCADYFCTGSGKQQFVCSDGVATCYCWEYGGANVGRVHDSGATCTSCPSSADPTWQ